MTLKVDTAGLFSVGAPPQGGDLMGVLRWCTRLFNFLAQFLRRPEFPGVVLSRIDTVLADEFKAEDGMFVFMGPGVLGANSGLYFRIDGAWKKVTLV